MQITKPVTPKSIIHKRNYTNIYQNSWLNFSMAFYEPNESLY